MLNDTQIAQYRQQGFLVLEELLPIGALAPLREAADSIVASFDIDRHRSVFSTRDGERGRDRYFLDSAEAVHCFLEEDALDAQGLLCKPRELAINKIGHALHDRVPAFGDFCRRADFAALLSDLDFRAAPLWQTMYIFKQPGIGGEVRWHQDASYLHCRRGRVIGVWVALQDADRDNGCLWLQPCARHSPLRERYRVDHSSGSGVLDPLDRTPWPSTQEAVAAEVPAGSVILFDSFTPHYSSGNLSARSRHAFTMHFSDADAIWSPDNWLQRRRLPPFLVNARA